MTYERNFQKSDFRVDFGDRTLTGDVISKNSRPEVLILHGAGNASRGDFRLIRQQLLIHGISSAAFDFTVPFNKGFTEIIRQPQSWGDSDAWELLSGYRGRLLIIAAENDKVIPKEVINKIYDSAVNAKECKLFVAPQASHAVFTDLRTNNPESFCSVLGQIVTMVKQQ